MERWRTAILVLGVIFIGTMAGCGSKYEVEYKIKRNGPNTDLSITIKGKAARLAVMLINPNGKTSVRTIENEDMIDNIEILSWVNREPLKPGTYTLVVKTFDPEKVVYKKELELTREDLNGSYGKPVMSTRAGRPTKAVGISSAKVSKKDTRARKKVPKAHQIPKEIEKEIRKRISGKLSPDETEDAVKEIEQILLIRITEGGKLMKDVTSEDYRKELDKVLKNFFGSLEGVL